MSLQELYDRVRYRFDEYWHSERRSVKLVSRLGAFALFALAITTIAPTLADELASSPEMLQPIQSSETQTVQTVGDTSTASASPLATFSPEPTISRPAINVGSASALPESSDSATAEGDGVPLKDQPKYTLRIPGSAAIDPRAMTYFMPLIHVAVDDPDVTYTLACINTTGATIDIKAKRVADNSTEGDLLISGDGSGLVILSGATNKVVNAINAANGAFISSTGGGLAGRSLTFRFVAVTKPVVDPEFCSVAKSGVITTIRALGLDISTVKGGGKLK